MTTPGSRRRSRRRSACAVARRACGFAAAARRPLLAGRRVRLDGHRRRAPTASPSPTSGVYLDASDPSLAPVSADLASYLGTMWGGAGDGRARAAPDGSKTLSLWLSTSPARRHRARHRHRRRLRLKRIDAGGAHHRSSSTRPTRRTSPPAPTPSSRSSARASSTRSRSSSRRSAPRASRTRSTSGAARSPRRRGLQPHTLHPIEYFDVFMQPGDANLADAKRYVDWLVKTGQNYVQWPLLSTVDWATLAAVRAVDPRLRPLARRARRRRRRRCGPGRRSRTTTSS